MSVNIESYSSAPLISTDSATVLFAIARFWRDVHELLNTNQPPEKIIEQVLKLTGLSMGADRAYTFSVTANRSFASCTCEWTRIPTFELKSQLQNIDQRGLQGWLRRFDRSTSICIEDVDNPPEDLRQPATKFKRDLIRSIYVFGFYDEGRLIGYLGLDYIMRPFRIDDATRAILSQLASTLNLFILRHEALELWKQTAKAMPSALFIKDVDNDLRYLYANPKYHQLYGESIVGLTDIDVFGRENGALFRQQDIDCLESGIPFTCDGPQYDYSRVAKGYYSTIKFPVSTKMGRHYVAGFISDISAEHNLRVQALDLLEKAKVAEKSKGLFLAAMSHEIRTPLNAIIGLLDELGHSDIPEATRAEYVASAANASRALLALINDVLDISKLESGQMHISAAETDLSVILAECESIFAESCRAKGITYVNELAPDLPILVIDTTRLRQILFNLISNSVKFTSAGGIRIAAGFYRNDDKTGSLTIEVQDTGIGISKEDQQHVFGLFEQASRIRGTSVANKGTGLGLCLCRYLAERMNGNITISSEVGKGSTFRVVLNDIPFVERGQASAAAGSRPDHETGINPPNTATRVLIVDDVPMNLQILGIILKRLNIEYFPAKSAQEALETLSIGGFTHVMTDIWMPEMNGEELAKKLRENPEWKNIRIAAQTADVEAANSFDTSLFDTVLSKPLTPEKVSGFINGVR